MSKNEYNSPFNLITKQLKDSSVPKIELPLYKTNPAAWTHEKLIEYIKDFETNLDNEQEIGANLVSFGNNLVFHIDRIDYYGPDIICFTGVDNNNSQLQLIQHISQLNVLLMAVPKLDEKPRRIGFQIFEQEETKKEQ